MRYSSLITARKEEWKSHHWEIILNSKRLCAEDANSTKSREEEWF